MIEAVVMESYVYTIQFFGIDHGCSLPIHVLHDESKRKYLFVIIVSGRGVVSGGFCFFRHEFQARPTIFCLGEDVFSDTGLELVPLFSHRGESVFSTWAPSTSHYYPVSGSVFFRHGPRASCGSDKFLKRWEYSVVGLWLYSHGHDI